MSRRTHRVEDLLRTEISKIILRRIQDPRVQLASVSKVDVSPDLKRAVVQISIIGNDEDREAGIEALRHAQGFIRSCLAKSLKRMRTIPELLFEIDRGAEYSQEISDLLEKLHEHEHESTRESS
jgi:ribosome-binding factor A